MRHCKGKEFNYVPVEPVIKPARKRVFYQTSEYDQIFEKEPTYRDPLTCGYSKLGSFLIPTLNEQIVNVAAQPNVVEPVETIVTDDGNGEQLELEEEPDSFETESDNEVTNDEATNDMEADDDDDDNDENGCDEERAADQVASYSDADMDEDDSYHHQNPFIL